MPSRRYLGLVVYVLLWAVLVAVPTAWAQPPRIDVLAIKQDLLGDYQAYKDKVRQQIELGNYSSDEGMAKLSTRHKAMMDAARTRDGARDALVQDIIADVDRSYGVLGDAKPAPPFATGTELYTTVDGNKQLNPKSRGSFGDIDITANSAGQMDKLVKVLEARGYKVDRGVEGGGLGAYVECKDLDLVVHAPAADDIRGSSAASAEQGVQVKAHESYASTGQRSVYLGGDELDKADALGAVLDNIGKVEKDIGGVKVPGADDLAGELQLNSRVQNLSKGAQRSIELSGLNVDPDLKARIDGLKKGLDPDLAGITDLRDTPAQRQHKIDTFIEDVKAIYKDAYRKAVRDNADLMTRIDQRIAVASLSGDRDRVNELIAKKKEILERQKTLVESLAVDERTRAAFYEIANDTQLRAELRNGRPVLVDANTGKAVGIDDFKALAKRKASEIGEAMAATSRKPGGDWVAKFKRNRLPTLAADDSFLGRLANDAGNRSVREIAGKVVKDPALRAHLDEATHFDLLAEDAAFRQQVETAVRTQLEQDPTFRKVSATAGYEEMIRTYQGAVVDNIRSHRQRYLLKLDTAELKTLAGVKYQFKQSLANQFDAFMVLDAGNILVSALRAWQEEDLRTALMTAGVDGTMMVLVGTGFDAGFRGLQAAAPAFGEWAQRQAVSLGMKEAAAGTAVAVVGNVAVYYLYYKMLYGLAEGVQTLAVESAALADEAVMQYSGIRDDAVAKLYRRGTDFAHPQNFWEFLIQTRHVGRKIGREHLHQLFDSPQQLYATITTEYRDWFRANAVVGGEKLRMHDAKLFHEIARQAWSDYQVGLNNAQAAQTAELYRMRDQLLAGIDTEMAQLRAVMDDEVEPDPYGFDVRIGSVQAVDEAYHVGLSGHFSAEYLILVQPDSAVELEVVSTLYQGERQIAQQRHTDLTATTLDAGDGFGQRLVSLQPVFKLPDQPGGYRVELSIGGRATRLYGEVPGDAPAREVQQGVGFNVEALGDDGQSGLPDDAGRGTGADSALERPPVTSGFWQDGSAETPHSAQHSASQLTLKVYPRPATLDPYASRIQHPFEVVATLPDLELSGYRRVGEIRFGHTPDAPDPDAYKRRDARLAEDLRNAQKSLAMDARAYQERVASLNKAKTTYSGGVGALASIQLTGSSTGYADGQRRTQQDIADITRAIAANKEQGRQAEALQARYRDYLAKRERAGAGLLVDPRYGDAQAIAGALIGAVDVAPVFDGVVTLGGQAPAVFMRELRLGWGTLSIDTHSYAADRRRLLGQLAMNQRARQHAGNDSDWVRWYQQVERGIRARLKDEDATAEQKQAAQDDLKALQAKNAQRARSTAALQAATQRQGQELQASLNDLGTRLRDRATEFLRAKATCDENGSEHHAFIDDAGVHNPLDGGPVLYTGQLTAFTGRHTGDFVLTAGLYRGIPVGVFEHPIAFWEGEPPLPAADVDSVQVALTATDDTLAAVDVPLAVDAAALVQFAASQRDQWYAKLAQLQQRYAKLSEYGSGSRAVDQLCARARQIFDNFAWLTGQDLYTRLGLAEQYRKAVTFTEREAEHPSQDSVERVERHWDELFNQAITELRALSEQMDAAWQEQVADDTKDLGAIIGGLNTVVGNQARTIGAAGGSSTDGSGFVATPRGSPFQQGGSGWVTGDRGGLDYGSSSEDAGRGEFGSDRGDFPASASANLWSGRQTGDPNGEIQRLVNAIRAVQLPNVLKQPNAYAKAIGTLSGYQQQLIAIAQNQWPQVNAANRRLLYDLSEDGIFRSYQALVAIQRVPRVYGVVNSSLKGYYANARQLYRLAGGDDRAYVAKLDQGRADTQKKVDAVRSKTRAMLQDLDRAYRESE